MLQKKLKLRQQKQMVDYIPNKKQAMFHQLGTQAKERLFLAGNRCGKTLCGAREMAMHLTGRYPAWWQGLRFEHPVRAWAASVTAEVTRDILQKEYLGEGGAIPPQCLISTTYRRGVSGAIDVAKIAHISGGYSTLGFKSYDQGREKFQGASRHIIHLDEEPDIDIYEECLLRTMDVQGHMLLTMTPLKGMTDICAQFLQASANSGKAHVQASWADATHLAKTEIKRLRASLRPHEVEARENGVPSLGKGKVFPVAEADLRCERFKIPPHFKQVVGLDFGWSNPTAAVWAAYDAESDVVYIYDNYYQAELPPSAHASVLKKRGEWVPVVCDPAGQSAGQADGVSLMEIYARHGVHLNKADNAVEAGLMEMLERMQTGRLKVFADLEAWWQEFRLYRRGEGGRIVKQHDHLMDATRYVIKSGLALARTAPAKQKKLTRDRGWIVV